MSTGAPDESAVWEALRIVSDPELGENLFDLGLVYRAECTPERMSDNARKRFGC